jgi:DNA-binding LacI/PurR family transcriptional regulator
MNSVSNNSSITSQTVALRAGVSVGTVHRVLTNQANVSDDLRRRVLEVVRELGYVHIPRKRSRVGEITENQDESRPTLTTVLFCAPNRKTPDLREAYIYKILRGVEIGCRENNISLVFQSIEDSPAAIEQIEALVRRNSIDGLVLHNYKSIEFIENLKNLQLPIILVDAQRPAGLNLDVVISDNASGGNLVVEHLVKLGHREIAFINGPTRYSMQRRMEGFRNALLEAGLSYNPDLIHEGDLSLEGGEQAMNELLARKVKFSAVFCANDLMAFGAIRALNAAGYQVPDDISVIGFDDIEASTLVSPALTTIHASPEDKGRVAINRLIERVQKPDSPIVWSILPVYLVERSSTAPCRDNF